MSDCKSDTPDRMVFYSLNTGGECRPQRVGEGIVKGRQNLSPAFTSPAGKPPPGYLILHSCTFVGRIMPGVRYPKGPAANGMAVTAPGLILFILPTGIICIFVKGLCKSFYRHTGCDSLPVVENFPMTPERLIVLTVTTGHGFSCTGAFGGILFPEPQMNSGNFSVPV